MDSPKPHTCMRHVLLAVAATLLLALALVPSAQAYHADGVSTCDNAWDGSANDGKWTTAANWSLNHAPTALENACINAAGTYTVTLGADPAGGAESTSVASLVVGGGASGTQTLKIRGRTSPATRP